MPMKFYDLVASKKSDSPFYSPNTLKTRLSLLHKGIEFETVAVTYSDLRTTWKSKFGHKATVPFIELEDGSYVMGSWKIALWLEKTYPEARSLFLPETIAPSVESSEYRLARNYAQLMESGFGDSDSMWSTFWELSAVGLLKFFVDDGPDSDYRYYMCDDKQGPGEWARLTSLDQEVLKKQGTASLLPIAAVTKSSKFIAGNKPGLVDYILYGRYIMMATACPAVTKEVWAGVSVWIKNLETFYAAGLKEVLERLPKD